MRRIVFVAAALALSAFATSCAEQISGSPDGEFGTAQQALEGPDGLSEIAEGTATLEPDAWERSQADAFSDDNTEDAGLILDHRGPEFDPNELLEGAIAIGYSESENFRLWTAVGTPLLPEERADLEVPQK